MFNKRGGDIFKKPISIAIVGPNYTGKTTLSNLLKEKFGFTIVKERWWTNPFFHYQPGDYFRSQIWFMLQTAKSMLKAEELKNRNKNVVLDTLIYSTLIFSRTKVNTQDFMTIKELIFLLGSKLPLPDIVIYLYASPRFLYYMRRIRRIEDGTGPKGDVTAKYVWLKQICRLNEAFFGKWNTTPILKINVEKIDLSREDNFITLLQDIKNVC